MKQNATQQQSYRIHPNGWAHLANLCESLGIGRNPLVSSLVIHVADVRVQRAIIDSLRQIKPLPDVTSSVTVTE